MLGLKKQGVRDSDIARALRTNNVSKYLSGEKKSFLTHLRAEYDRLGPPSEGRKWLPLRMKPRGTPNADWIQVPPQIRTFSDIVSVLDHLKPTQANSTMMTQFGYRSIDELIQDRTNHFGFFVGAKLGDAGKQLRGEFRFPSMRVSMTLSMAKPNSERFNEFTALSANNALGLEMHRIADQPPSSSGGMTRDACFRWITPVSPIITWVFRVVMGFERGELTTYNKMRADWLLDAPRSFKVHFLQGLAESDGWVNPGTDNVIIVASPNESLLSRLLSSLDIPHMFDRQQKVNIVKFETEKGLQLPAFNERIHSNYYDNLLTMANAKRFRERSALPNWFISQIQSILSSCTNYDQACLDIARKTGYKISNHTVKNYIKGRS
jgi:hypothetical protein